MPFQSTDSLAADTLGTQLTPADIFEPNFWSGIGTAAFRIALIIALAMVVLAIIYRFKNRWVKSVQDLPTLDKKRQRVLTVADLLGSVSKYVVWTIAFIMILGEMRLNVGPLLAGAGIAGLAIGFGAQTLVKDIISGFFLLFDSTIGVGDLITIGGETGTVEYVGLRLLKVRKFSGELLMVPAGELRTFGNHSIGYSRVIVNVGLSYEEDINRALEALNDAAQQWAGMEEIASVLVDDPQVQGVVDLGQAGPIVRLIAQVQPGEQFQGERLLRLLVKQRCDREGIEMQVPRSTVYFRQRGDRSAPSPNVPSED